MANKLTASAIQKAARQGVPRGAESGVGEDFQQVLQSVMSEFDAQGAQAQAQPAQPAQDESLTQQFGEAKQEVQELSGEVQSVVSDILAEFDQGGPAAQTDEEAFAQPDFPVAQDAETLPFGEKLAFEFAQTDSEKRVFLEKTYGPENVKSVKQKDGVKFYFRPAGEKRFRRADKDFFDIVSEGFARQARGEFSTQAFTEFTKDLTTEAARPLTEFAVEAGIEIPAALLGGPVAAVAALPASGAAAVAVSNTIQEALGVPIDPRRSTVAEASTAAVINTLTAGLIKGAGAVVPGLRSIVPGAGKNFNTPEARHMTELGDKVLRDAKELQDAGIVQGFAKDEPLFLPNQINFNSPSLKKLAPYYHNDERVLEYVAKQEKNFADSLSGWMDDLGPLLPKGEALSTKATDTAVQLEKRLGQNVGKLRTKAVLASKNAKVPLENTRNSTREVIEKFSNGSITVGDAGKIMLSDGNVVKASDPQTLRIFTDTMGIAENDAKKFLKFWEKSVRSGDRHMAELPGMTKQINELTDKAYTKGKNQLGALYSRMRAGAAADRDVGPMAFLTGSDRTFYAKSLQTYAKNIESVRVIKDLAEKNPATFATALMNAAEKDPKVLDNFIRLNGANSPIIKTMRRSFLDAHAAKLSKQGTSLSDNLMTVDPKQFRKKVFSYNRKNLEKLMGKDSLNQFEKLTRTIEFGLKKPAAKLDPETDKSAFDFARKLAVGFFSPFWSAKLGAGGSLYHMMQGKGEAVAEWISREGFERLTKGQPSTTRQASFEAAEALSELLERYGQTARRATIVPSARASVQETVKALTGDE